jgi:hypothetical protein
MYQESALRSTVEASDWEEVDDTTPQELWGNPWLERDTSELKFRCFPRCNISTVLETAEHTHHSQVVPFLVSVPFIT